MPERKPVRQGMRGYFGIGIFHTKSEWNTGSLFRTAQAFGAAFAFTIGLRFSKEQFDTSKVERHIPFYHYADFQQFLQNRPQGAELIGVELTDKAADLRQFWHPERCIYLLGAEDDGLPPEVIERCDKLVALATPFSLNVSITGSIVLWDRITKATIKENRQRMLGGS
jgi:tRNA (guanosine-2'-O-)-methyltransferase